MAADPDAFAPQVPATAQQLNHILGRVRQLEDGHLVNHNRLLTLEYKAAHPWWKFWNKGEKK